MPVELKPALEDAILVDDARDQTHVRGIVIVANEKL